MLRSFSGVGSLSPRKHERGAGNLARSVHHFLARLLRCTQCRIQRVRILRRVGGQRIDQLLELRSQLPGKQLGIGRAKRKHFDLGLDPDIADVPEISTGRLKLPALRSELLLIIQAGLVCHGSFKKRTGEISIQRKNLLGRLQRDFVNGLEGISVASSRFGKFLQGIGDGHVAVLFHKNEMNAVA